MTPRPDRSPLRRFLLRLTAMTHKEVMHILRDRQMLAIALVMPPLLLFLFGFAVTFDIERIPVVVVDQDHTAAARQLVDKFEASRCFHVVARRDDPAEVETLIRAGAAKAALIIPEGYARRLDRGSVATAQLLVDGSDGNTASIALGYADAIALEVTRTRLAGASGPGLTTPPIDARTRTLFNPALRSAVVLVPGLVVFVLSILAVMLTALTVAREYERGSMEQLFATPVGRIEVVLGKLGPYFVIGLVQTLMVLTEAVWLFGVPVAGSLVLLTALASVFLLAMLMQGLVISTVTRNQMVASLAAALSSFLPALLLSGFIFPIENMPRILQWLSAVLPGRYLVHGLRAVLLRGNGLAVVGRDLVALALFFGVMLAVAVRRFRRQVA